MGQAHTGSGESRDPAREISRPAFLLGWDFDSPGGVNGVVWNLLREFQKSGHAAPIAIDVSAMRQEESLAIESRPWPLLRPGRMSMWNPQWPVRSALAFLIKGPGQLLKLSSICRRHSIGVLNPHFIGLGYFPLLVMKKLGLFEGKLILSFHGADIRGMMQSRGLERRLSKALLRGADVLVACSDGLREEILTFVPECASRAVSIPNGIDVPAFLESAAAPFQLPAKFEGRKIILSIGAYEYKKGHDVLLRAFSLIRSRWPETALVIAGQRDSAPLAQLARDLTLQEDILLLENLPHTEIVSLLQRADLFVLSSRWEKGVCGEGFAMALLESAAARKPVVSTLTCGVSELIRDGIEGRLVPTEDPQALAEAISGLLSDPARAVMMASRLHERVRSHFTWKDTYRGYAQLFAVSPADSKPRVP